MWLQCAGSLIPNITALDDSGVDAAYGTVAHGVCETWLRSGVKPRHLLNTQQFVENDDWGFMIDIDDDMFDHVYQCVSRCQMEPGDHIVERRVYFSQLTPIPNQGGTMDFAALMPGRALVHDHKFGKSPDNMVFAEENPQAMLYALGIMYEFDSTYNFQDFVVRIAQPRLNHYDEWHTTRRRLLEFAEFVKERAALAWQVDAPRSASEKACKYCRVKASCSANAFLQNQLLEGVFDDLSQDETISKVNEFKSRLDDEFNPFEPAYAQLWTLSTEQIVKLHNHRKMAEKFWNALGAELFNRATVAGENLEPFGLKLVEARSKRLFIDENKARDRLLSFGLPLGKIEKKQLVSPAQAEKLLKAKRADLGKKVAEIPLLLSDLVRKPPGKATLAPLTDNRDALVDLTDQVFDDPSINRENPENSDFEEL
jgi:hypothetical protein